MECCVLCVPGLTITNKSTVEVTRGLQTIINVSVLKGDGVAARLKCVSKLTVHTVCRNKYTHHVNVKGFDKENCGLGMKRRSSEPLFDKNKQCLYCTEEATDEHGSKVRLGKRRKVRLIKCPETREKILNRAEERNDDLGRAVMGRINAVSDVATGFRYHDDCLKDFFLKSQPTTPLVQRGRPRDEQKHAAFLKLCDELEHDEECQFSVCELLKRLNEIAGEENAYTAQYLEEKLRSHYGTSAHVTDFNGRNSVFCFKGKADQFVYENWHAERTSLTAESDRNRVLKAAAQIIVEDVRSKAYDLDNYYCGAGMDEEYLVPDSLRLLLTEIIKSSSVQGERLRESLGQAVVQACRPRSFISPILLAVGLYIHRHQGCRTLIDLLHNLGFSASYGEVQRFLLSAVNAGQLEQLHTFDEFLQFAFDNADYNVRTIDGHNTFHNMGGIRCTTPAANSNLPYTISRTQKSVRFNELSSGRFAVRHYKKPTTPGLRSVTIREVRAVQGSRDKAFRLDLLWMSVYILISKSQPTPSWNGYNQEVMKANSFYDMSSIHPVPFINMDPGNLSCIYTALIFAEGECRKQNQKTCIVTFDQPLFQKAAEIAATCKQRGELLGLVVRLGGFHLVMSFMGAIGYIMSGSGMEKLWGTVYAENTVTHMIKGHAFSRALRALFLTQLALAKCILEDSALDLGALSDDIRNLHMGLLVQNIYPAEAIESEAAEQLFDAFSETVLRLSRGNRTASLWITFFEQVSILRSFIRSERLGDWDLHLDCIRTMLPYFHAAGHLNYGKSAQLYIQSMEDIEHWMDAQEYEKFTSRGFFVIRRTDRYWSGLAVDLTIEQVLMRSIKTDGGLSRGRGITESTLSKWIDALPHCVPMCNALEEFSSVRSCKSEQHVELRDSRQKRDLADLSLFSKWLEEYPPFQDRPHDQLVALDTGLIADKTINCDRALQVGEECVKALTGGNFADVKLKRSKKVKPLSAKKTAILKIDGDKIRMNCMQFLNRILCIKDRLDAPLSDFLGFELAPRALSLFDGVCLRKTQKSALEKALLAKSPCLSETPYSELRHVVDGGYLMHLVAWPRPAKYSEVCHAYVSHVRANYGTNCKIRFDGYDGPPSTKSQEQRRRSSMKTSANVAVTPDAMATIPRENFLGNIQSKKSLIRMLIPMLRSSGMDVEQAESDADVFITRTAIDEAKTGTPVSVHS